MFLNFGTGQVLPKPTGGNPLDIFGKANPGRRGAVGGVVVVVVVAGSTSSGTAGWDLRPCGSGFFLSLDFSLCKKGPLLVVLLLLVGEEEEDDPVVTDDWDEDCSFVVRCCFGLDGCGWRVE